MAANYNDAVVTTRGVDLINTAIAQEKPIVFTKVATGDGRWNSYVDLRTATALINLRNSYTIVSKTANENQYKLKALISNYDPDTGESVITTSYNINEVGIYAKLGNDGTEILYAIITAETIGDVINAYDGANPTQIVFSYVTTISTDAAVTLNLTGAYALAEDLVDTQTSLSEAQSELDSLSTSQSELASTVGNHATNLSELHIAVSELSSDVNLLSTSQSELASTVSNHSESLVELDEKLDSTYKIAYGKCTTAAATQIKDIEIEDDSVLKDGDIIAINFENTNSFNNSDTNGYVTFKINNKNYTIASYTTTSGTITKPTGTSTNYYGIAKQTHVYKVDATNGILLFLLHSVDSNTTYSPKALGFGYGTCTTAAATVAKVASLSGYNLVTDGIVAIRFTNAVPASATLNINSKGAKAIYHKNAAIKANIIEAGDVATFIYNGSQYHLLSIDRDNQKEHKTNTVTLTVANWNTSTLQQTVTASNVTASNTIIVSPDPSTHNEYSAAGIRATAQAAGKITFTCDGIPEVAVKANILIFD